MVELISLFIDIKNLNRFCIEVDPRTCSPDKLKYYHEKGVNNISIGIQDLDPQVQKAVNRVQPVELVERLMTSDTRENFKSINFDFLVGLPMQTESSIKRTMEKTVSLSPDRVSLCFFHYTTEFYPHMKMLEKTMPDFFERKRIFEKALEVLTDGGYIRTGFEHFAKPDDIVAKGLKEKKATYTSLGAISEATNVIATGRSGHSIISNNYLFQNYYEQELYANALSKNEFPIYRGMKLSNDDILRRDIIRKLRTYFIIKIPDIESRINTSFKDYFQKEIAILTEFAKDELVILTDFDNYLKSPRYN